MKTRIMVVEDEGLVAEDLEERLSRLDYHCCCTVDNGRDALNAADQLRPDLVLMDIRIRGGMDGIEVASRLRASNTAVIFLTAHADNPTLERARLAEPFGYVLKPFNDRELRATIEMAVFRHREENKLRKMEGWLARTLDSIGDGVVTTDLGSKVTFMNPTAELITGWRQREALGRDFNEVFQLVHEETLEPFRDFLPSALAGTVLYLEDPNLSGGPVSQSAAADAIAKPHPVQLADDQRGQSINHRGPERDGTAGHHPYQSGQ